MLSFIDVDGWGPRGQVRLLFRASHQITKHAINLILQGRCPAEWLFQAIHCSHFKYLIKSLGVCLSQRQFQITHVSSDCRMVLSVLSQDESINCDCQVKYYAVLCT